MTGSGQCTHGFQVKPGEVSRAVHGLDPLVSEEGPRALILLPRVCHPVLGMDWVVFPGEETVSELVVEPHQHHWKREKTELGNLFG